MTGWTITAGIVALIPRINDDNFAEQPFSKLTALCWGKYIIMKSGESALKQKGNTVQMERGKLGKGLSVRRDRYLQGGSNLLRVCCLLFCAHSNFGDFCTFLFLHLPSYESSRAKSLHYKTIRSEGSGNAAGIQRSLPTAAMWKWRGRGCLGREGRGISEAAEGGVLQKHEYDSLINTATFHI